MPVKLYPSNEQEQCYMYWFAASTAIMAVVIIILVISLIKRKSSDRANNDQLLNELKGQVQNINQNFFSYLQNKDQNFIQQMGQLSGEVNKQIGKVVEQMFNTRDVFDKRLESSGRVLSDLQRNLGEISQVSQRIFDVGKDISGLQEILKAPKLRGIIGEVMLEELLSEILPKGYINMQYRFNGGDVVDAVLRLKGKILPVDSKFPLENFKKAVSSGEENQRKQARRKLSSDVRKHIDTISSKYILVDEGTLDCAFMYIPAENVYYDLFIKGEEEDDLTLNRYAFEKKVIPVSPNTFFAFLQLVLFGLKGLHIEENAKYVMEQLLSLRSDLGKFTGEFGVLGKHITNMKNKYDDSERQLKQFFEKFEKLGEEGVGDAEKNIKIVE